MFSRIFRHQWVLVCIIIFVCIAASLYIVRARSPVETKAVVEVLQDVRVVELKASSINIPVYTQGIVEPRTRIRLVSEVNGRVLEASNRWVNGGFVRKGEVLLAVEDFYYQNQLARAKANVAQANSGLKQEQGIAFVAKQDWDQRSEKTDNAAAKELALRQPQMEAIKSQLSAAEADQVSAERLLEKTKVTAPFNGVIANKIVDPGQNVSTGMTLGDLLAIDVVEIRVPLTEAQQAYLDLPDLNQATNIPAKVNFHVQNHVDHWKGVFVRTEGILDPVTKVLNGVVQVQDPYGLSKPVKSPLRLGAFVEVTLQGKKMDNIFVVPRRLLYTGNVIWLVNAKNEMESRVVDVLPIRDEDVYIYGGVKAGEKIIAAGVFGLLDGKKVKTELVKGFDTEGQAK